jgi:hypothetical protein
MSVQHESVGMGKVTERLEAAPELEYRAVNQDSLSMFLAAIGGAVLGMLLTLLVLALINGGTLTYAGERIQQLESHIQQVDENLGAVSANIDIVSNQAAAIAQQLGAVESAMRNEMAAQGNDLTVLNESVTTLNATRQQFDIFVGALTGALSEMGALESPATSETIGEAPVETPLQPVPAQESPVAAGATITASADLTETAPLTEATLITESAPLTASTALTESPVLSAATELTETVAVTESTSISQ